ncbi:MAG TPA: sterol desaturase family protein [Polyangia bacterium]|nr:sterol desaturase family protein [Polyangia bacterium]
MLPAAVVSFRQDYRAQHIGAHYSGLLHFAFTSLGSLAVIVWAAAQVRAPSLLELCTVPATFLFANFVEYRGHKGPMHKRRRGLALLFERHTQQHHRYYTHQAMSYEGTRDFKMVLFPPVMLLFFLGAVAVPVAALLFWIASRNVALLYVATAMGYFLTYEWLHFCHHLPAEHPLARVGVLRRLRAHHQTHHDPARMNAHNFNITFPICDRLFGTLAR